MAQCSACKSLQLVATRRRGANQVDDGRFCQSGDKQIEENSKDEASAAKAKEFIEGVVALFLDSAKSGQLESAINVTTEKSLNIAASVGRFGWKEKWKHWLQKQRKRSLQKRAPVEFKVMTGKHGGANLHKISFPLPPQLTKSHARFSETTLRSLSQQHPKLFILRLVKTAIP